MANVTVKWNRSGYYEVLNSAGVGADLMRRGEAIKRAADAAMPEGGYVTAPHHDVRKGKTKRGIQDVVVVTHTNEAKAMQAKHDTLTRALDAGR